MTNVPARVTGAVAPHSGSTGTATGIPSLANRIINELYLLSNLSGLIPQVIMDIKGLSLKASGLPAIFSAMAITSRIPFSVYIPPMMCLEVKHIPAKNLLMSTSSRGNSLGYVGKSMI